MDSSGVHLLLEHHRRASETGARFAIIDGPAPVARVLRLWGLHEMLTAVPPQRASDPRAPDRIHAAPACVVRPGDVGEFQESTPSRGLRHRRTAPSRRE
jgi:hypothetical protein